MSRHGLKFDLKELAKQLIEVFLEVSIELMRIIILVKQIVIKSVRYRPWLLTNNIVCSRFFVDADSDADEYFACAYSYSSIYRLNSRTQLTLDFSGALTMQKFDHTMTLTHILVYTLLILPASRVFFYNSAAAQ